jgi:tRNA-splicing ligase RtcB
MQVTTWQLLEVRDGKPIKLWTEGVPVESEARQQLINTAKMPFIFKHLAVMPDVHLGKGSTIGSVIPTVGRGRHRLRHDRRAHHADRRRLARQPARAP